MTLDELKAQLAETENQHEAAKAVVYRTDGAVQMLRHIIAETESAAAPPSDPPVE